MLKVSEKLKVKLSAFDGVECLYDSDLKKYSTMKLDCSGTLIKVTTIKALQDVTESLNSESIPYKMIGWGANLILPEAPDFVFIKLDIPFDKSVISPDKSEFRLPASAPLNVLTSLGSKFGLSGWEVFTGIPASLGGAIAMNAGTSLGEIGELVKEVLLLRKSGNLEKIIINQNSFSYRKNHFVKEGDIILEAVLIHKGIDSSLKEKISKYLELRTNTQPLREKTCGCMFKNKTLDGGGHELTCRAGLYLDILGLKGLKSGNMRISPKHANFMENRGGSGSADVKNLVENALEELNFHYGVKFETEVDLP